MSYLLSLGVQTMHCWVIDTWGRYSIVVDTPYIHIWSSYPLIIGSSKMSRKQEVKTSSSLYHIG
jgi:hypothetical protein